MSSPLPLGALRSAVVAGVESTLVTVEVHRSDGVPTQTIVGLAGKAVRESLERIHSACRRSDLGLEPRRTTVNLAPADCPKGGTGLDLPIALGMLIAEGVIAPEPFSDSVSLGELQLDGTLRPVPGVLPAALAARRAGVEHLLVARGNAAEAAAVAGLRVTPLGSLAEAVAWARGELTPAPVRAPSPDEAEANVDLAEIAGHALPRRALEIAAAGGHHLLMSGLPGAGKTLLARALPGILPPLSERESLETSAVYSVVGKLDGCGLLRRRPFRAPHHSVTAVGLIGGGVPPRPGEASLAHGGVLFLDEMPEFRRAALECLRQPLEEGEIHLVRGGRAVTMPARFQLVGAMNPCPCGQGPQSDRCRCTLGQVRGYWRRLSGPLLDRIDLVVGVEPVALDELITDRIRGESSDVVRERVVAARAAQQRRWVELDLGTDAAALTNAALPAKLLGCACGLSSAQRKRARERAEKMGVSARGWHRVLRVARTLADLGGREDIVDEDLAEAFQYRQGGVELFAAATSSG
ncbi:MAG: YifB family Mg chelatase-like AAA ATPase [Acidobacteriota bacterium]|jgi:magnesium chelatase family protein